MSDFSNDSELRVRFFLETQKISKEVGAEMKLEIDNNAVELISELLWKQLEVYADDLELFAKHAKRTGITTDDVKLLVRRNEALVSETILLKVELVDQILEEKKENKKKRKDEKTIAEPNENIGG